VAKSKEIVITSDRDTTATAGRDLTELGRGAVPEELTDWLPGRVASSRVEAEHLECWLPRPRLEQLGVPKLADAIWRHGKELVDQRTDPVRRDERAASNQDRCTSDDTLSAAGYAEQGLVPQAQVQVARELVDGLRLVAGGLEIGDELEVQESRRS
jgi:hypothetical protein